MIPTVSTTAAAAAAAVAILLVVGSASSRILEDCLSLSAPHLFSYSCNATFVFLSPTLPLMRSLSLRETSTSNLKASNRCHENGSIYLILLKVTAHGIASSLF